MAAQQLLNNYVLDKRHTFVVTLFDDFEKYARVPLEYEAPEPKDFAATVRTRRPPSACGAGLERLLHLQQPYQSAQRQRRTR
jgi:hypothetical protein